MTKNLKEEQKKEAIERMKMLAIHPPVIQDFKRGQLYKSEVYGILYWLDEDEEEIVKEFEEKHNATVYHVVKNSTQFGVLLSFFYVGEHKHEWYLDKQDIKEGRALCYVENLSDPSSSEFGYIAFVPSIGGIMRTA